MYGTDENSGLLDANRRRGVGGVPMALQAAMLVTVALALTFLLYHVLALPVDLQMLPSWKWRRREFPLNEGRIGATRSARE